MAVISSVYNYVMMKHIFIFCLLPYFAVSQCPISSVTLNTQAEVDNFIIDYPNCTVLNSSLRIEGPDIENLNGLSNITALNMGLLLLDNPLLSSLNGLNNVESILGIVIIDNPLLTNFQGFENLEIVNGQFQIESNHGLQSFDGLENLDTITGQLFIYFNMSLSDISAMENLDYLGAGLVIANSFALSNCSIQSLCDYIQNPNGFANVISNAEGCNSLEELEEACQNCLEDNVWIGPPGGTWHLDSHWSLSEIPTDCHHVSIPVGSDVIVEAGTSAVAYSINIAAAAHFETEGNATIDIVSEN